MMTSIVFEIEMPNEEAEAYKALSDTEKEITVGRMKNELAELITDACLGETTFTKFVIEFKEEGE